MNPTAAYKAKKDAMAAKAGAVIGKKPKSSSRPGKYKHIDFVPPAAVAKAAARGLAYRRKATPSNRGGFIKQMRGFLSRSEKSSKIGPDNKGTPWNDKGYVAWLLWGGDPAKAWVGKVTRQMDAADAKASKKAAPKSR